MVRTTDGKYAHRALLEAQRILIVGPPGSGKSTFAKRMQAILKHPVHHLDDYLWGVRWQQVDFPVYLDTQRAIVAEDTWIIDGTHFLTIDIRLRRADVLCIVNLPRVCTLLGFFGRAVKRACGETASLPVAIREDPHYRWRPKWDAPVLKSIFYFRHRILPTLLDHPDSAPRLKIVVLRNHRQKRRLLRHLELSSHGSASKC